MPSFTLDPRLADHTFLRLVAEEMLAERAQGRKRSAEDQALYEACRWDLALFAKSFLPHWCPDEFNQFHLDYYARYAQRHGSRGHFDAIAAPRGHAKTMACCLVPIVHACVYQVEAYTIYVTYRYEDAVNKVRDIRDELESNADLVRVYGRQVGENWNNADATTCNGQRVRAASASTQLRGALSHGQRPTWVILDDAEHAEHVLNADQRDKTWSWLVKEILHLGQPSTSYTVFGTILHEESMLKTLLTTPGWQSSFYQAVQQFADPASIPLWQAWRGIYLDLSRPAREADADTFFAAHESELLRGSQVLWPTRRPYLDLMKSRLREGESSFWQELQGVPLGDQKYVFQMDDAAFCTIMPHGIVRSGGTFVPWESIVEVAIGVDPTPDKKDVKGSDYSACPVVAQDRDGYLYVLDAWVEREPSTQKQIEALVNLIWRWSVQLVGIESNNFASLLVSDIREAIKQRAQQEHTPDFDVTLVALVNMRNKIARIKTLEPMVLNSWLQFSKDLPAEYFRQFREFLPLENAGHDDAPDATEMAIRTVKHMFERRDIS